jgi:NAD(P)-dependent dehydrogenase (short-subunit alcohol dehydrogenase family)
VTEHERQQKVLITAGASGIGKAMAQAFQSAGARVWVVDVDEASLEQSPSAWIRERVDVKNELEMAALFERVSDRWGGLDVICANAGTSGPTAALEDQPADGFQECMAVNLFGAFLSAKGALRLMKQAGRGCILFTSSTGGIHGFPLRAPYSAAKWAVNGLMKTVAMAMTLSILGPSRRQKAQHLNTSARLTLTGHH